MRALQAECNAARTNWPLHLACNLDAARKWASSFRPAFTIADDGRDNQASRTGGDGGGEHVAADGLEVVLRIRSGIVELVERGAKELSELDGGGVKKDAGRIRTETIAACCAASRSSKYAFSGSRSTSETRCTRDDSVPGALSLRQHGSTSSAWSRLRSFTSSTSSDGGFRSNRTPLLTIDELSAALPTSLNSLHGRTRDERARDENRDDEEAAGQAISARSFAVTIESSPCMSSSDETRVPEWKSSHERYLAEGCTEVSRPVGCTRALRLPCPRLSFQLVTENWLPSSPARLGRSLLAERLRLRRWARSEARRPALTSCTVTLAFHRIQGSPTPLGTGCFAAGFHSILSPCFFCS